MLLKAFLDGGNKRKGLLMVLLNCWCCWRGSQTVVKKKGISNGTVELLNLLKGFLDGGKQERDSWKNPFNSINSSTLPDKILSFFGSLPKNPFNNINSSTVPDKILSFSVLYLITPSTASTVQQYHYHSISLLPPSENPFNSFNSSTVPEYHQQFNSSAREIRNGASNIAYRLRYYR